MSKRAEALAQHIEKKCVGDNGVSDFSLEAAVVLIDDFARKERERAAQRVRKLAENTMDNIPLIDAIAAILADEED